jgi:hypothetical protein
MVATRTSRTKAKVAKKKLSTAVKNFGASYNTHKSFKGKQYTGMQVGRSHKWHYDQGNWKETKITPDLWHIYYAVTKRRAGKAPKGSGAAVGTEYHWYITAHQNVKKLNADDYSTELSGFKYKLAHKRADKGKWSATAKTQRKHLIEHLENMIKELKKEPIPIEIEYNSVVYKGEAIPVTETCHDGICDKLDITLNDKHLGILRYLKSGWKLDGVEDKKFISKLAEEIVLWYE